MKNVILLNFAHTLLSFVETSPEFSQNKEYITHHQQMYKNLKITL